MGHTPVSMDKLSPGRDFLKIIAKPTQNIQPKHTSMLLNSKWSNTMSSKRAHAIQTKAPAMNLHSKEVKFIIVFTEVAAEKMCTYFVC